MRAYKQWSPEHRRASLEKTKLAIASGLIPEAKKLGCNRCKQKEGIIEYHNCNYDHPTKYLEALCYRCHMMIHNFHNNPQAVFEYFEEVWRGKCYEPVFKRDYYKIMYQHGVFKRKASQ